MAWKSATAMTPFPGTLARSTDGCHKYILNNEQEAWLVATFPITENQAIIKAMGISYPTLYNMAHKLGIRKSEEGMAEIRRRRAEWHKRLCRQERLRLLGGGQPQCCQNIRLQPFTKSQICRRNKAVHLYGYNVTAGALLSDSSPDRWSIFYDENTKRSNLFEANCKKAGFKIEPLR
jgi:hypothetical protein